MIAPEAIPTYLEMLNGLHQYQLAVPILHLLATAGTLRYRDLLAQLGTAMRKPIYTRTLSNALQALTSQGLITRIRQPRRTEITITDLGLSFYQFVTAMSQRTHSQPATAAVAEPARPPGRSMRD